MSSTTTSSSTPLTSLDDAMIDLFRVLSDVMDAAMTLRDTASRGAFMNGAEHLRTEDVVDPRTLALRIRAVTDNVGVARTELVHSLAALSSYVKM